MVVVQWSSGTSTLSHSQHLQTVHANVVKAPTPKLFTSAPKMQMPLAFGRKFSEARQEHALLTKMIVANMSPLSLVDDEVFREFVNFLEPEYRVLCHHTFCARLDGLNAEFCRTLVTNKACIIFDGTQDVSRKEASVVIMCDDFSIVALHRLTFQCFLCVYVLTRPDISTPVLLIHAASDIKSEGDETRRATSAVTVSSATGTKCCPLLSCNWFSGSM